MKIISKLEDKRISSKNFLIEIEVKDYLELAKKILEKNEFQRKRVKGSSTIYSLLKSDFMKGCILPPLVLALYEPDTGEIDEKKLEEEIKKGNFLILDGLQRTNTLIDLEKELIDLGDQDTLNFLYNRPLRVEIYTSLNRLGILYRMLTLNTGQTPVSLRHQIEILYLDYLIKDLNGIKLLREVDEARPIELGEYKFEDVVEGFNSYLERDELPLDRLDVLDNIKGLDRLSKENQRVDLFQEYITTYNKFISKMDEFSKEWIFNFPESNLFSMPFGSDIKKIFVKSQPMTGFGAAVGKLIEFGLIANFAEIEDLINRIIPPPDINLTWNNLLKKLDDIKNESKKIGNSQRMFFQYFFRELFNKESDSFLNLNSAIDKGYRKYISQV